MSAAWLRRALPHGRGSVRRHRDLVGSAAPGTTRQNTLPPSGAGACPAVTRLKYALSGALLLWGGSLAAGWAQQPGGADLPRELLKLPPDPQPGTIPPLDRAAPVWAVLELLDGKAGFGVARSDDEKQRYTFRLPPYARLWRFGAPGAAVEEFQPGDRVLLKLWRPPARPAAARGGARPARGKAGTAAPPPVSVPGQPGPGYALEVRDEISEQVRLDQCYRMAGQDADNYRFTAEGLDRKTGSALPERLMLEYARETFLVLREDPVYAFKVRDGTPLWINTGFRKGYESRIAHEVLDESSAQRFRDQQRLRLAARADAAGGPGYALTGGPIQLFPDFAEWARRLQPGDSVRIIPAGAAADTGQPARVKAVRGGEDAAVVTFEAPPDIRPKQIVRVLPAREGVSYSRDIRPILDVNCLSCHRAGDARGGYSLSTPERMRTGSRRGPGIVPGKSDQSMLYLTMSGDRNPRMPPDRDATPEQLVLLKRWIDAGAPVDEMKPEN
jgi:hypothetical protein